MSNVSIFSKIQNRKDFRDYILRNLGEPVIKVNVDEKQISDRIDESVNYYLTYHSDGISRTYLKHQLTLDEINNEYIDLPDTILGVVRVFPFTNPSSSRNIFDLQYQLRLNDLYDLTSTSVIYYDIVMNHLSLLDLILNGKPIIRFNRIEGRLYLDKDLVNTILPGNWIVVECYRALDPETNKLMWNDLWIQRYATALLKKQWANNVKKYGNMQLPGGIVIDGQTMYLEAKEEIKELEDDLMNKNAPLDFYMG
jgi:hypothetical protein